MLSNQATAESLSGGEAVGASVALRYSARAGLLPELSRQTYDSLFKALREAILNAVDAGASRVEIDLSKIATSRELIVQDDGRGMTTKQFCDDFMSLGGSGKFGDVTQFGRIGIGSLALLQYSDSAIIETKVAGASTFTRAILNHARDLKRGERQVHLEEMHAGSAAEIAYQGPCADHFTRVNLIGVNEEAFALGTDPGRCYALLDKLRRVLPLPWPDARVCQALERQTPDIAEEIRAHVGQWIAPVFVHTTWERDIRLLWRPFGEDTSGVENWSGPLSPFVKTVRIDDLAGRRRVVVAGYLLSQARPTPSWMGLTARVQNVAVEENCFFDVTADPGFRKYISGEVWIFGDVDRERLINIDRASFNRESPDYRAIQRYMARAILDFKSAAVQRPQRQKVAVRRMLEQRRATLEGLGNVASRAAELHGAEGLPSSEAVRRFRGNTLELSQELAEIGARALISDGQSKAAYVLGIADDGGAVVADLAPCLAAPAVTAGGKDYRVEFTRGSPDDPAVVVRNRPRRVVVNLDHPTHQGSNEAANIRLGLALEMSYLLSEDNSAASMYQVLMELLQ